MNRPEFVVIITFIDKDKTHSNTDTWFCRGISKLRNALVDTLDLVKDKNGIPVKPELKKTKAAFTPYIADIADESCALKEFHRQQKAFKIYKQVMSLAERSDEFRFYSKLGGGASITVFTKDDELGE